jgi:hypothetical protein
MATSSRSSSTIRSNAASASAFSGSKTPASIHSSRQARSVVSETWWSRIASMSTHDAPVTRRIRIPRKHNRSDALGR